MHCNTAWFIGSILVGSSASTWTQETSWKPCLSTSTACCNPNVSPKQICPNHATCQQCGGNACECPDGPSPAPAPPTPPSPPPTPSGWKPCLSTSTACCNPNVSPKQFCPNHASCQQCGGGNACECPNGPSPGPSPPGPPSPPSPPGPPSPPSPGFGECGIATNMLDHNDAGMTSFCNANLGFWWNWAYVPRNSYSASCANEKFVPMFWGTNADDKYIAQKTGKNYNHVMGFNEPDHWGPPPYPGGDTLSAGTFAEFFHCSNDDLAMHWQEIVTNFKLTNPTGLVISPAMADAGGTASAGDFSRCNSALQQTDNHMDDCFGWLKCFKEKVIGLQCGSSNCWDAIDVIQFHAYYYESSKFISKVKQWEQVWAEDLNGSGGRSKKSLWITEFAHAGTTDPSDPDGAGRAFMEDCVNYMKASPYVSGWSWFSQDKSSFASFTIDGRRPTTAFWDSSLISKSGQITALGQKYIDLCSSSSVTSNTTVAEIIV